MLPVIPRPPISARQKGAAVAVAGFVDLLQILVFPALGIGYLLDDAFDVIAAIVLTAICGFKWQFILAFMLELVPGLDLFPTWTAVALLLPTRTRDGAGATASPQLAAPPKFGNSVGPGPREMVDTEAVVVPPVRVPPKR